MKAQQIKTSKKKVFTFFSDPSHGWMKVPRKLLVELKVESQISSCSYQRGDFVYLEEDRDAGIVLDGLKEKGVTPVFKESISEKSSRIRSYSSYAYDSKANEGGIQ